MTEETIRMGDGRNWTFVGGAWTDSEGGVILPPPRSREYGPQSFQAFRRDLVAGDLTAVFDFRINGTPSFCEPRLIVRAQDPSRYYAIGMPAVGQSWRSKSVWAAIWRVEANGMHRLLRLQQVLGVVAEHGRWYTGRVECEGDEIRFWVDGRPIQPVRDDAYTSGRIGFGAWGPAEFRNVRVIPTVGGTSDWDGDERPAQPWFLPCPVEESIDQSGGKLCRLPSDEIILWLRSDGESLAVRSQDAGRTWRDPEPANMPFRDMNSGEPMMWVGPVVHRDGSIRMVGKYGRESRELFLATSEDGGRSWSEPCAVAVKGLWPERPDIWYLYSLQITSDGAMVLYMYTEPLPHTRDIAAMSDGGGMTWAGVASQAFSMRSDDGGQTWSAPVNLDGMWWPGRKPGDIEPSFDMTEAAACMAPDGRICCMTRPIYSPVMWQTWSHDGGRSWEPTAYGPFPGYQVTATQTVSGAMVFAVRFPCLTVYVSHDGGVTWRGTMIDYASQGGNPNGILEVEPDVILLTYNLVVPPNRTRAQRLRITPEGMEPA